MKKLDKAALAQRDEIIERLEVRFRDLEAAVDGFNHQMTAPWLAVQAAIEDYNAKLDDEWGAALGPEIEQYNEAVADANQWRQDAAQSITDYMEERSEKWQEGDAGQRYTAWRDEFDGELPTFDAERPDDLEIAEPEEIPFDVDDAAEMLGELPAELDSDG